jgi:hypothetical protein
MLASHPKSINQKNGFALVIALSLMAFILLLVLSLSTLVQVESSSASINRDRLQARVNAELGAMIALGDLQRYTGPDQRVTCTGEIISNIDDSKKKYTAVWDASGASTDQPIGWLSSIVNPELFDVATKTEAYWPIMVPKRENTENIVLAEAVRAEPITILGTNGASEGRFAYWVGDEGVKARLNLFEKEELVNNVDQSLRLVTTTRSGIEAMSEFASDYSYGETNFREDLAKVTHPSQLAISASNSNLLSSLKAHSHDLSTHSKSLLVDVRKGMLKEDLTYLLSDSFSTGSILNDLESLDDKFKGIGIPPEYNRITWEQLASFHNLSAGSLSTPVQATAQTDKTHGVFPILTMLNINFAVLLDSNYDASAEPAQTAADRRYSINHHLRPWFVLANPYNKSLQVSNYRIRLQSTYTKAQVETDDGELVYPELAIKDLYKYMVFTVPSVLLEPGQAKIFSLSYNNYSDYDYTFDLSTYTANYECDHLYGGNQVLAPTKEQEFIFEEGWDDGIASIRFYPIDKDSLTVVGTVMEEEPDDLGYSRIKPLTFSLSNGGSTWMRTTIDSNKGEESEAIERVVQLLGPSGFGVNNSISTQHLGYWNIAELPEDVYSRPWDATINNPINSQWKKDNNSPGALSYIVFLNHAVPEPESEANASYGIGWLSDLNLRTPRMSKMQTQANAAASYRMKYQPGGASHFAGITKNNIVGTDSSFPWGSGYAAWEKDSSDSRRTILFDLPSYSLSSLGQLQHFNAGGYIETDSEPLANWSDDLTVNATSDLLATAYAPAYCIGNSYTSPFIDRKNFQSSIGNNNFLDLSYVLNEILFDRYFFSSILDEAEENGLLTNSRLKRISSSNVESFKNETPTSVAEAFYTEGGFNVNSTSVDAWHSFLNTFRGFSFGNISSGHGIFPRSLGQMQTSGKISDLVNLWTGWRHIEKAPLRDLAEAIVDEVKLRGPFLCLADFVNRDLTDVAAGPYDTRQTGLIQAALDRTINKDYQSQTLEHYKINYDQVEENGHFTFISEDNLGGGSIRNLEGEELLSASTVAGIPGWVLQGDLLQSLAPAMTVRSDTFIVRSYGSAGNGFNAQDVESYLELIVQRTPEYINPLQDNPSLAYENLEDQTNQKMGRRYKIISQRYLTASEL